MITLEKTTFGYSGDPVHRDLSLKIEKGDVMMITGPNGVGKSTLLKIISGVMLPWRGKVSYNWQETGDPRMYIGYLPDSLSIYKSMKIDQMAKLHWNAFGTGEQPLPLLEKASISRNSRISELSVGQRVIFHLDLILSTRPKLILIDEVLHSVDSYLRELALKAIVETIADRSPAVVMVNLNYTAVEHLVNRIVFLTSNGVSMNKTSEELTANGEKISDILCELVSGTYREGRR
ncbi:hypothetical protein CSA37_00100 [Candidatus Fermentibacteria bacterium]|nr:MAG: hypothetical protein CSA37_00100 [Candidatus Fermentibacteria bacterium]